MNEPESSSLNISVGVTYAQGNEASRDRAADLSLRLGLNLRPPEDVPTGAMRLVAADGRLELWGPVGSKEGAVSVDFADAMRRRRVSSVGSGKELIARAVGFRGTPLSILDATAGFARDAFVLAQLGCRVHALERSPIVAALVEDGIARARASGFPRVIAALDRLTFACADARAVLEQTVDRSADLEAEDHTLTQDGSPRPEIVYIDPMYPQSGKSALNRKELRILRAIVGDDPDALELLAIARRVARLRVVVKRPRLAPPLSGKPDVEYKGSSVRYDVYLSPNNAY